MIVLLPWLAAMVVLIGLSAFFSASEAALFYLGWRAKQDLRRGNAAQRAAAQLLENPDRLLSAVLFWNLAVNMAYFAIASRVELLVSEMSLSPSLAVAFPLAALLSIIFCSEMVPKSVAVLSPNNVAGFVGLPLAMAVRLTDPLMPLLQGIQRVSRRVLWPNFRPEPDVHIADLERAVSVSSDDVATEAQFVLRNIVELSEIRVVEWMRPRTMFQTFRPPFSLSQLSEKLPPSGYAVITEPDSEDLARTVRLHDVADGERWEQISREVLTTPWCANVATAWQQLLDNNRDVAAIVNEFGETIGILTREDIIDSLLSRDSGRSERLLNRKPIERVAPGVWHVVGMASLRRLGRTLGDLLPPSKAATVGGLVHEQMQRIARAGDECSWGPYHLRVLQSPERGNMLVELTRRPEEVEP